MLEKDLNRIINKAFKKRGFSHKMQDPPKAVATSFGKNPFDGFSFFDGKSVYWESKLKKGYGAFAFTSIREHQIDALQSISEGTINNPEIRKYVLPVVIWGVYEPRKTKRIFAFHIDEILRRIQRGEKSIKKHEIHELEEEQMYVDVKGEDFDVENLVEKIIWPRNDHGR